jgi:hypothetical protein
MESKAVYVRESQQVTSGEMIAGGRFEAKRDREAEEGTECVAS